MATSPSEDDQVETLPCPECKSTKGFVRVGNFRTQCKNCNGLVRNEEVYITNLPETE